MKIELSSHTIEVLHFNKASLTVMVGDNVCFVTRRIFNEIARRRVTTCFIVEKEWRGSNQKWLAIPSIF
jgi:hypothetical protein